MTWFKVDDAFDDDPRMFDAPDCAISLWTRAGTWASRNLTDGLIPAALPARKCEDPERAVEELVRRGVWAPVEGGWVYVEWLKDQPSREQVLEKRRKEAEKKARMRAALAEKRRRASSARPQGTPSGTPVGSPSGSPSLPDPGSLPSSGTPAGSAAASPPPANAAQRAAARKLAGLSAPKHRKHPTTWIPSSDRPLMNTVRDPVPAASARSRPVDAQRAEQDRLAELDAVQVADAGPGGVSPPPVTDMDSVPDQQKRDTA